MRSLPVRCDPFREALMSSVTVGLRELKSHLSAYVRRVKAGDTVVITER